MSLRRRCSECGNVSVEKIVGDSMVIRDCLECEFSEKVTDEVKSKEVNA